MKQKNAWIYCRIDAPEDSHGALKNQYEQLEHYAAQMGFAVAGCSQDMGTALGFDRPGLQAVRQAAEAGKMEVLLVVSRSRLGRDDATVQQYIRALQGCGLHIFSPMEGEILPTGTA